MPLPKDIEFFGATLYVGPFSGFNGAPSDEVLATGKRAYYLRALGWTWERICDEIGPDPRCYMAGTFRNFAVFWAVELERQKLPLGDIDRVRSVRCRRELRNAGIQDLGELRDAKDEDLLRLPNFGPQSLKLLKEALREYASR